MYKLEKIIKLYKNQFGKFLLQIYGDYRLDRTSLDLDAILFRIKYILKRRKDDVDKIPELRKEFINKSIELRTLFGEFVYSFLSYTIPDLHLSDIEDLLIEDIKIDTVNVTFKLILISENEDFLNNINSSFPEDSVYNLFPHEFFRIYNDSYNDGISKAYPELFENRQQNEIGVGKDSDVFCHNLTFQTSEACNLQCTYCYQMNKTPMRMSFDIAKEFIDHLLNDDYGYINRYNSPAIIIEFIGGEPFLEITLTRKIYEYFLDRCYELNHPWFTMHRLSICSNGLLYFDEKVQKFFKDYSQNISFNISIDGNKSLHDACRIQPNGMGSYDIDMAALDHYSRNYTSERNSKMTLAPSNIKYLFNSVVDFINRGMYSINVNCVFEEGWNKETARTEYEELKKLADYLIENRLDNLYISIFREKQEDKQDKSYDGNFCFKGDMLVSTPSGSKYMNEIKLNDILYTASGSRHKVEQITRYLSRDNIIFKAAGAFPIRCTSDHKFLSKVLLYNDNTTLHYSPADFRRIKDLNQNDLIGLPIIDFNKNTDSHIGLSAAYFMGAYLAIGHLRHYEYGDSIILDIPYDFIDRDIVNELINSIKYSFDISHVYHHYSSINVLYEIDKRIITNDESMEIFKACEEMGNDCNKHVPSIIFNSTEEIVERFIAGFADFNKKFIKNKNRSTFTKLTLKNPLAANDLLLLLRSIGKFPTCYCSNNEYKQFNYYEIYYNDIPRYDIFSKDLDYSVLWAPIYSIDPDRSYMVYCPTVMPINNNEEEHTIIVNGTATTQCGGVGSMISIRPNGDIYPCLRYMPTSVGSNVKDLKMGSVNDGFIGREENSEVLDMMDKITRRSQTDDICFECPLSNTCATCSALSHTVYGTPNKRTHFICIQSIAEHLANVYYWNRLAVERPEYNLGVRKLVIPDAWALLVINQDELTDLKLLELLAISEKLNRNK